MKEDSFLSKPYKSRLCHVNTDIIPHLSYDWTPRPFNMFSYSLIPFLQSFMKLTECPKVACFLFSFFVIFSNKQVMILKWNIQVLEIPLC